MNSMITFTILALTATNRSRRNGQRPRVATGTACASVYPVTHVACEVG
jgi:hypothetical protein